MNKAMLLPLALVAAGAAHAGTYSVLQDIDCRLITAGELSQAIQKAGTDTGLNLPKDMALRAEVHCARDTASQRFVYTIRATIEKLAQSSMPHQEFIARYCRAPPVATPGQ